jgi:hypothetical protein
MVSFLIHLPLLYFVPVFIPPHLLYSAGSARYFVQPPTGRACPGVSVRQRNAGAELAGQATGLTSGCESLAVDAGSTAQRAYRISISWSACDTHPRKLFFLLEIFRV